MYTIAIIDDDVYIGNMLEDLLNRNGYSVIRAYSGTEALLLLKGRQPDLILLDLMLPRPFRRSGSSRNPGDSGHCYQR